MALFTATTNIDNKTFTGSTPDTLYLQFQKNLQTGDYFDGGLGTDKIQIRSSMAGEEVFDVRGINFRSFEQLSFYPMGGMDMVGTVTFTSDQFGTDMSGNALISNSLFVIASNFSATDIQNINIHMVDGNSAFDASGWTFTGWRNTGADADHMNIYGSSGDNTIAGTIMSDTIDGGEGTDTVEMPFAFNTGFMVAGTGSDLTIAGTAGTDRLKNVEFVRFADGTVKTTDELSTLVVNHAPTVVASGTKATGAITERTATTGSTVHSVVSGKLMFKDSDLADTHTLSVNSVTASGNTTGLPDASTLAALMTQGVLVPSSNGSTGSMGWVFSAPDSTFDYLAHGEKIQLAYLIAIEDGHGGAAEQTVTITVTGANDAPAVTEEGTTTGTIGELEDVTGSDFGAVAAGDITFTDVEVADKHTATVAGVTLAGPAGGPAASTLKSFLKLGSIVEDSATAGGMVDWTFQAPDKTFDWLGEGETATLNYSVTIKDSKGATATEIVSITVNGANDDVAIATGTKATATISERTGVTGSTIVSKATGKIAFSDRDRSDVHTPTLTGVVAAGETEGLPDSGVLASFLSVSKLVEPAGTKAGSLTWTFAAADKTFDYLGAGDQLTLTYTVELADGKGSSVDQDVVITVNGKNDAPKAYTPHSFETDNLTALTIDLDDLLVGAGDPDGDAVSIIAVGGPKNGTVKLDGSGNVIFTPKATYAGPASFTYTLSDGLGGKTTATALVEIDRHLIAGTEDPDTLNGLATPSRLEGAGGDDLLNAGKAGDVIDGGSGNDTMYGGAAKDIFVFDAGFGNDTIVGFVATGTKRDLLSFDQTVFASSTDVINAAHQDGSDVVIVLDASNSITVENLLLSKLTSSVIEII